MADDARTGIVAEVAMAMRRQGTNTTAKEAKAAAKEAKAVEKRKGRELGSRVGSDRAAKMICAVRAPSDRRTPLAPHPISNRVTLH